MKHHPTLLATGRHGCWATCHCGWSSETYGTTVGAHLAFGRHLVGAEHLTRSIDQGEDEEPVKT